MADDKKGKPVEYVGPVGYESGSLQKAITSNSTFGSTELSTDLIAVGAAIVGIVALMYGFLAAILMFRGKGKDDKDKDGRKKIIIIKK